MQKATHRIEIALRILLVFVFALNGCEQKSKTSSPGQSTPATPSPTATMPQYYGPPHINPELSNSPDADAPISQIPPKPSGAQIEFSVFVSPAVIDIGKSFSVRVVIKNNTNQELNNFTFSDVLEKGLEYVLDTTSPVTYAPDSREVYYFINQIAVGRDITFQYNLKVVQNDPNIAQNKLWIHTAALKRGDGKPKITAQTSFLVNKNIAKTDVTLVAVQPEGGWYSLGEDSVFLGSNAIRQDAILVQTPINVDGKGPEKQFELDLIATAPIITDNQGNLAEQTVTVTNTTLELAGEPSFIRVNLDQVVDLNKIPAGMEPYIATYDEANKIWVKVPITEKDYDANTVTIEAVHFSTWGAGLGSSMPQNGAGALLFDQPYTSLFTGAANYRIPVWTPPGRAGMAPSVSLSYSSSTVDGVLGDVQAPWVGMGWNIDDTEIVRAIKTDSNGYGYENSFALTLNGTIYPLVRDATHPNRYYVKQYAFLYIELHNEALGNSGGVDNTTHEWWEVITADGTKYRLGWNVESEQLALMYGYACTAGSPQCNTPAGAYASLGYAGIATDLVTRRWRVDRVTDRHGNYIEYTYAETQPAGESRVALFDRSSYLETISYTGYDGSAGHLDPRYIVNFKLGDRTEVGDTPTQYNVWDFVDDKLLDKIEICYQTCDHPIRTYDLAYSLSPAPNANGTLILTSISISGEVIAEGEISISKTDAATIRFTYQKMPNRAVTGGSDPFNYPRLVRIENGYGGKLTYTYETDNRGTDSWYDYRVRRVDVESGLGKAVERAYSYLTPAYAGIGGNPNLGELIGYTSVSESTLDFNNADLVLMVINHQFGTSGLDVGRELLTEQYMGATVYQKTVNTYVTDNSQAPFQGWNYRYLHQVESFIRTGDNLQFNNKVVYLHDPGTGNLVQQSEYQGSSLYRQTFYEYIANPAARILGKVSRKVTTDAATSITSDVRYFYDYSDPASPALSMGDLTLTQTCTGVGDQTVDLATIYDDYGNVTSSGQYASYGTLGSAPTSTYIYSTISYDETLQTYAVEKTDRDHQITTTDYLYSLGLPYSSTDPNDWTTVTTYDGLGRILSVTPPGLPEGEAGITYSYPNPTNGIVNAPYNIQMQIWDEFANTSRSVWGIYDGLGRVIQNQVWNDDTDKLLITNTAFNAQGLASQQSIPYEAVGAGGNYLTPSWASGTYSSTQYDGLGRAIQITSAGGLVTHTGYDGLTTTTIDPNGNLHSQTTDRLGRLVDVGEYMGTTHYSTTQYSYDTENRLIEVIDAQSNITTNEYNWLGEKTTMDDPDMGNWSYEYDALGNLTHQVDGRGQDLIFQYDDLNRLILKYDADAHTNLATFEYSRTTGEIGMRILMVDQSGRTTWSYSDTGRTVTETRTIDNESESSTTISDWLGRVLSTINPAGEVLTYQYDALGRPDSVVNDSDPQVTLADLTYDALGRITSTLLGNGVTVTNSYDSNQRLLNRLAMNNADETLVDFSYTYDNTGNITRQTDAVLGETHDYTYDGLNRLNSAVGYPSTATPGTDDIYRQNFSYDKIGDILQISNLGLMGFDASQGLDQIVGLSSNYSEIRAALARRQLVLDEQPTDTPTDTFTPTETATLTETPTPTETRTPTPATGTGLLGEYYDNIDLTALRVVRYDPQVQFNWGQGSPDPSLSADTFSVRWTGQVEPVYSQTYTFYVNSDDGVRLWVNNQLIVNRWSDGAQETSGTIALTAGTKYPLKLEYYEGSSGACVTLSWSSASQAKQVIPESQIFPPAVVPTPTATPGSGTGLLGEYYSTMGLNGLKMVRIDPTVNFDWGNGSPDPGIQGDYFSVRWSGYILPIYSETYTFEAQVDDGVRLWIDDQLLFDAFCATCGGGTATISLTAGVKYTIKMEYLAWEGPAYSRLYWSSVSQVRQIVPQSQLFPPEEAPTPTLVASNGNGLKGEYFNNESFTYPTQFTRNDAMINFNWGTSSPGPGMSTDFWGVRWTGQILPRYSQIYTFKAIVDDGVRLWVDNQQLINQWGGAGTYTGSIWLTGGQKYDIKIEYYDHMNAASAYLYWSGASQSEEIIPQSQLFSEDIATLTPSPTRTFTPTLTPVNGGLVGYWSFDDIYYTTVPDDSGRNHAGGIGGGAISYADGQFGQGMTFDGVDDNIGVAYHSDFAFANSFSISTWINPTAYPTGRYTRIIDRNGVYALKFDPNGNVQFVVAGLTPSQLVGPKLPLEEWNLVTGVYDQFANQLRLYVNGEMVAAANVTGTVAVNSNALYFGSSTGTERFSGRLDEVRLYSRMVNQDEIRSLYNAPAPTATPTPSSNNGLRGEYYDNADLTGLWPFRTDLTVNFDWGTNAPLSGMGVDTFSVRWSGIIRPPSSGTYTFYTMSDDGVRLWVNGQQIINNWTNHYLTEDSGTINLSANQDYSLVLKYYENTGPATILLLWSGPGQSKRIIPPWFLFQPTSTPTPSTTPLATSTATPTPTASITPMPISGLVAYWDFDEGAGVTVNDRSGNDQNGTLINGPAWSADVKAPLAGVNASALNFDGVEDYVNIPIGSFLPAGSSQYTISAWIRPDQMGTECIFGMGDYGTNNRVNALRLGSSQLVNYWWGNDFGMGISGLSGAWHHVAASYDGSTRRLYLDGTLLGTDGRTGLNASRANIRIGSCNNGEFFDGRIDDVRIYNRGLSATEVTALARGNLGPMPTAAITATSTPQPIIPGSLPYGNGADGSPTVPTGTPVNLHTSSLVGRSCADMAAYNITQLYGNTAILNESPSIGCLNQNDEVLLINLKGGTTSYQTGRYEFLRILSVNANIIIFTTTVIGWYGEGAYDNTNIGLGAGQQRVVIQRVPNYDNLTIVGNLTGNAFDGNRYGVIAFRVSDTLSGSGTINANGLGFAGGTACLTEDGSQSATNGQSYDLSYGINGAGLANVNGPDVGGGGAGYETVGSQGISAGKPGGKAYGSPDLSRIYLGSGGAGGNCNWESAHQHYAVGGGGGNGGGAVLIMAKTIDLEDGQINSTGITAGRRGGSGSGGSIRIEGEDVTLGIVSVTGGGANPDGNAASGSSGRLAIYYTTSYQATVTPGYIQGSGVAPTLTPTPTSISFTQEPFGDGSDGDLTISSGETFNIHTQSKSTSYSCADGGDAVSYIVTSLTSSTASLSVTPSAGCLSPGDEVMLINLQGGPNTGNFEYLHIGGVVGSAVYFETAKSHYYGSAPNNDANIGAGTGKQRVVIQRVPNYNDLTLDGILTGNAFDGSRFGVIVFRVNGILSGSGTINANELGYPAGISCQSEDGSPGTTSGQSYDPNSGSNGGGLAHLSGPGGIGGGGAGYSTIGSQGVNGGSAGGLAYGAPDLTRVFLGSGGAGGDCNWEPAHQHYAVAGGGGIGGGAILILARTVDFNGQMNAKGGQGGRWAGSGSGGSVRVDGKDVTLETINVAGGGANSDGLAAPGSSGRIAIYYSDSYDINFMPGYLRDTKNGQPDSIDDEEFESGLTSWTTPVPSDGLTTNEDSAYWGEGGLQVSVDDNNDLFIQGEAPNSEQSYHARFYINTDDLTMSSGDQYSLFSGQTGQGDSFRVEILQGSAARQIRLQVVSDTGSVYQTGWYDLAPATGSGEAHSWHAVEIYVQAAGEPGAFDGSACLWLDGELKLLMRGIDNDAMAIESVRLGVIGVDTSTRGSLFIDDFASRRYSTLGLLADPGSLTPDTLTSETHIYINQPDETNGYDSWINSTSSTTNYGVDTIISIGESNGSSSSTSTLIKFDLSSIPVDATITHATLFLTVTGDYSNTTDTLRVFRLKRNWVESQATWNIYASGQNWSTAGGMGANDIDSTLTGSLTLSPTLGAGSVVEIRLSSQEVKKLIDGTFPNYGWLLTMTNSDRMYTYASSASSALAYRPKLVIEYTTDAPTPTPTPTPLQGATVVTYSYSNSDHVHAVTSVDRGETTDTYRHDANGNMTCRMENSQTFLQAYNAENRMAGVLLVAGNCDTPGESLEAWVFTYDGDGNRVEQVYTDSTSTLTTYYFVGGSYEVRTDGSTTTVVCYYSFVGMTVAMNDGSGLKYFLTDHLGSIVAAVDSSGTLLSQQRYLPFGRVRTDAGSVAQTDFGYTGQRNNS